MRRLTIILTAFTLLTACSGGLGSLAKKNVCCIPTMNQKEKVGVCDVTAEGDETEIIDEAPAPTLLTGFMMHR